MGIPCKSEVRTPERRRLGRDVEIVPWEEVAAGREDFGLSA